MDVQIRCICPPKDGQPRHEHDTVTLRDRLGLFEASSIRNAVLVLKSEDPDATAGDLTAAMTEANVLAGITAWTVVDDKGKPIPATRDEVRRWLLPELDVAIDIAEKADELYQAVMLPLVLRAFKPLPDSPTKKPTSRTNGGPAKPRRPSKQSSISTIPTADTATTSSSLDGVSSSSQNSESAA